uniref:tRNA-queuosine alpha-mannosyltransferase n=1 Tax=Dermatophagoides pteronyssinus TaxID=6956 RepID=A0A6P6XX22_DERPT|nr:glycosyltransferase-like domain-containing protein 1 isoform X2 [Dermatophagoides pteronyssinus]
MTNKKQQPSLMIERRILIIEPFYSGSHKRFIETLLPLSVDYDSVLAHTLPHNNPIKQINNDKNPQQSNHSTSKVCANSSMNKPSKLPTGSQSSKWPRFKFTLVEMTGKKWHWRSRTSALYLSRVIINNADQHFDVLFTSSILNLAELIALRPDIARISYKIIYFHENQLAYPIQHHKERDFQYGYNQILSSLVADKIVFNSKYNRTSFIGNIRTFLKMMPDYRPPDIDQMIYSIEQKSRILYYPIRFNNIPLMHAQRREKKILHIIWPHRWEHDKNPEAFFNILFRLKEERQIPFKLSVLGENYSEIPKIFVEAKTRLAEQIVHWGYVESNQDYYDVLASGNCCISTALHEFFGVSMLAAYCGCYPLCPSRLVYPEIFPAQYIYESDEQLLSKLEEFGRQPDKIPLPLDIAYDVFDWIYCQDEYRSLFTKINHKDDGGSDRSTPQHSPTQPALISTLTSKFKSSVLNHK